MNKKQLLVMIPLLVAVIGLMYYGIHGKSQPASVGNLVAESVQPIDYSLPDD
jgi:ABC-type transporter Mla maintaining outer membrane lipid asymmetry permease subunit MlaE